MTEPWQNYQRLLEQQNRVLQRSDFIVDSDSSESSDSNHQQGHGDDPEPSTSGTPNDPQPSTSGTADDPKPSTSSGIQHNRTEEETSDSEISDLSSLFGNEEPAIRHFHEVTKDLNQDFLPVTSLQMPPSKRKGNSQTPSDFDEPANKKKKMEDNVMGISVHVIRAHHRQEKKFGFLVSTNLPKNKTRNHT